MRFHTSEPANIQFLHPITTGLTALGCEKVFQEKHSGASHDQREAVNAAPEFCREGDVLVFTKLDWLSRSMLSLEEIAKTLKRKGADFIVLDQSIDTTGPHRKVRVLLT